jgi:starch synthase
VEAGAATGIQFHPVTIDGLRHAIIRAFDAYSNREGWRQLQEQAMAARFSWDRSAKLYAELYAELTGQEFVEDILPSRQVA